MAGDASVALECLQVAEPLQFQLPTPAFSSLYFHVVLQFVTGPCTWARQVFHFII